jgi:hypothetical protein
MSRKGGLRSFGGDQTMIVASTSDTPTNWAGRPSRRFVTRERAAGEQRPSSLSVMLVIAGAGGTLPMKGTGIDSAQSWRGGIGPLVDE